MEAENISTGIDQLKDINIIYISIKPLHEIREFLQRHGLDKYKNIIGVRDISYMMASYFDITTVPFHAFFNKDHKLIGIERNGASVEKMANAFK